MRRFRLWGLTLLLALCVTAQAVMPGSAFAADLSSVDVPEPAVFVAPDPVAASDDVSLDSAAATAAAPAGDDAAQAVPLDGSDAAGTADAARSAESGTRASDEAAPYISVQEYNAQSGLIDVRVSGVPDGTAVQVTAWPVSKEDRAGVYDAEPLADGTVQALVPVSDFGFAEGWYTFSASAVTGEETVELGTTEAPVAFSHGTLDISPLDETENGFSVRLENAEIPEGARVWIRVTHESGAPGTGRIYPMMARDYGHGYTVYVRNHGECGLYTAMVYIGTPITVNTVLGTEQFQVDGVRSAAVALTDIDGSKGTFGLSLTADAPSGIEKAQFAVWSEPDQSDLQWYDAVSEDGVTYAAHTEIAAHNWNSGTYSVQAHVELGNGISMLAAETQAEVELRNYAYVTRTSPGEYRITLLAPDPADGQYTFAVWSDEDGQDDIEWYDGVLDEESHAVYADMSTARHADAGAYTCVVLAGDSEVASVPFDVPESDLLSEAERRIAQGCQYVYDSVGTDLYDNYLWVVNNFSYIRRSGHLSPEDGYTREQWYAVEGLENQSGNCYTFAAAFTALARGLGYDATYVEGDVWGAGQKWWPHGFVLIERDGSTYICDPELEFASTDRNLYMQPVSSPKATYRW